MIVARLAALLPPIFACLSLAGCGDQQPRSIGAVILRDGKFDSAALAATGVAAGAAPARDVSCQQQSNGADPLPDCAFKLHPGQVVFGPYLPLAPGAYDVEFNFVSAADCQGGAAVVDIVTSATRFKPLAQLKVAVHGRQSVRLSFTEDRSVADGAPMEFRARLPRRSPRGSCIVLSGVRVLAR